MNTIYLKQTIELAIKEHKLLHIEYVSKGFEISERVIEPIEIKGRSVYARDTHKRALRLFDFEGIQSIKIIEKEKDNVKTT